MGENLLVWQRYLDSYGITFGIVIALLILFFSVFVVATREFMTWYLKINKTQNMLIKLEKNVRKLEKMIVALNNQTNVQTEFGKDIHKLDFVKEAAVIKSAGTDNSKALTN